MVDGETPKEAPKETPKEEPSAASVFEAQAMAALEKNDQVAQSVVEKMMDGSITQDEGTAQLKAVRLQDTEIGTAYGQRTGGLQQVQGLLAELEKGGASGATVKRFQQRVEKMYTGKQDADLGSDLVSELRTGKSASATRRDAQRLLDPNTPMDEIREIRARMRAVGE